jgi:hypothetical protein
MSQSSKKQGPMVKNKERKRISPWSIYTEMFDVGVSMLMLADL